MVKPENLYLRRNAFLTVLAAVIWLALCALFIFLAVMFDKEKLFDSLTDAILFYVADGFFCAVMLVNAILNLLNLRRKFIIYTDEKGIYHYSGFVHLGFIPWEEIGEITCTNAAWALLNDGAPRLRIYPKNPDAFWKKLSFIKRFGVASGGAGIKVRTLGTRVKPQALGNALLERKNYYTTQH